MTTETEETGEMIATAEMTAIGEIDLATAEEMIDTTTCSIADETGIDMMTGATEDTMMTATTVVGAGAKQ